MDGGLAGCLSAGGTGFCLICRAKSATIYTKWGCGEVVKRISCRVVRSVPFKRSGGASRRAGHLDAEVSWGGSVDAVNISFKSPDNSVVYRSRRGAVEIPLGEDCAGRILDFYA